MKIRFSALNPTHECTQQKSRHKPAFLLQQDANYFCVRIHFTMD
jgi:hypothetical protein